MSKATCFERIDDAIALLNELKAIMDDGAEDAPQAFLEAAQDAQEQINRAIADALIPVLSGGLNAITDDV